MGATLPVMCKYFATEDANLGQQVSYLYSVNTLGAAAGCLFAGYFLIGFFGVLETALLAAGINLLIGLVCIVVFKKSEPGVSLEFGLPKPTFDRHAPCFLHLAFAYEGLTRLEKEVLNLVYITTSMYTRVRPCVLQL